MNRNIISSLLALAALPALTFCGSPAALDSSRAQGARQINSRNDNLHVWLYADTKGVCFYRSTDGVAVRSWPQSSPTHLSFENIASVLAERSLRLEAQASRRGADAQDVKEARKFNEMIDWIAIELTREDSDVKVDEKTEDVFQHIESLVSVAASKNLFSNVPCRQISTRGEILSKLKSGVRGEPELEAKVQGLKRAKIDLASHVPTPVPARPRNDLEGVCRAPDREEWASVRQFAYEPSGLNRTSSESVAYADDFYKTHACGTFQTFKARFLALKPLAYEGQYLNMNLAESVVYALRNAERFSVSQIEQMKIDLLAAKSFFYDGSYLNMNSSASTASARAWIEDECGDAAFVARLRQEFRAVYDHAYSPSGRNMNSNDSRRVAAERIRGLVPARCASLIK